MDDIAATVELPEINFGKEVAKQLAISTVVTVGVLAGFAVTGLAVEKFQKVRAARAAKKEEETKNEE